MSDKPLPGVIPDITPETRPFWDGTLEGKLILPRCDSCDAVIWYPRAWCGDCGCADITWFHASGRGQVYSYTVTRRGRLGAFADATPYVLAYVTLDEGPTIMTNLVNYPPGDIEIGAPLEVVFEPTSGAAALPRFQPAGGSA